MNNKIGDDHYLYLVGNFLLFGDVEVSNIVRFDVLSQQSESLCGGVNGKTNKLKHRE